MTAISASATGIERKDAKVQRRKESPKEEAFKKYPGTVPAFWAKQNRTDNRPFACRAVEEPVRMSLGRNVVFEFTQQSIRWGACR
jgi:hypothetical protein